MKVWYPSDWIDDYDVSYNKVLSWRSDGLPAELQLAVVYSDPPISQGYMYTKNTLPSLHFYFPEPEETWVSVGTGRYTDEWFWKANAFPPYDVEVEIERSSMDPNRYRINNPYTVANSAFRRTPAGDADEYMYLQIDPESNVVSFGTLVTGMTRDKSGSIESNSGEVNWGIADTDASPAITGKSVEASRVIDGTASAPRTLQLYSAYYDSADYSYFYTASTGYKYLWFPAAYEAETWSSFCNGTYKDNIYDTKINGSSTLGTVTVDIQQSSLNSKRFRIANPYTKLADYASLSAGEADDYLYLQYGNGLVWFDTFRPGLKMDSDSHRMLICHPVASNINGWTGYGSDFTGSSVLSELSDGTPTKVQLGANWLDALDPTNSYCYTRGGNYWSTDDRIVITFNSGDKAVITPRQYPMITNFHNPVEVLTLPEGTLDKLVVKVTGLDDYSSVGLRLYQYGWMDSDYITPTPTVS